MKMKKFDYEPPYSFTDKIVNLISEITEILTKITINYNPRLRRDNIFIEIINKYNGKNFVRSSIGMGTKISFTISCAIIYVHDSGV